jgi:OOP family OmpA-OmpF porin
MRALVVCVATLCCPALRAAAEPVPLAVEGGGFAGAAFFPAKAAPLTVPETSSAFGVRAGYALSRYLTLEGELSLSPTESGAMQSGILVMGARAHGLVHLYTRGPSQIFLSLGGGGAVSWRSAAETQRQELQVSLQGADTDGIVDGGLGFKFHPAPRIGLRLDLRYLLEPASSDDIVTAHLEILFGAYLRFGSLPERTGPVLRLAPDPDGDNVRLLDDWCPAEAEDQDGYLDDDGCPELDNDNDKIADREDLCPGDAEDANGIDDGDGCPDPDDDHDGVLGSADQCPTEAEDKDGAKDDDGCPDPDNDGDGIVDVSDKCPDDLEFRNGLEDDDGCPDALPDSLTKWMGVAKEPFKKNKAKLGSRFKGALKSLASELGKMPAIFIQIRVHSNEGTDPAVKEELSKQRVQAIVSYLAEKGVVEQRIQATALGAEPPAEGSEAPRKKKRLPPCRVEIQVSTSE